MSKLIKGIHHVALKCGSDAEFEKTMSFYTEVLGLEVKRSWAAGAMIDAGDFLMELFREGKVCGCTGAINHFAFAVENVDELTEKIRAAGYAITKEPTDICIPSEPPLPARIAFCVGPVGEEIELFCEK